jgi:hypothetical protein
MSSLGFALVPETYSTRDVEWRGHGITVTLDPREPYAVEVAMGRIIHTALTQGAETVREGVKKALGLRRS